MYKLGVWIATPFFTRNFTTPGCFQARSNLGSSMGRLRNSSIIFCDGKSGSAMAFFRIWSSVLMANLCSLMERRENQTNWIWHFPKQNVYFQRLALHPRCIRQSLHPRFEKKKIKSTSEPTKSNRIYLWMVLGSTQVPTIYTIAFIVDFQL